eukprot:GFUD01015549.1.p1 GENE.GFUD01015549.1~~GFUD01015549.1.p1  ORF type:complete len:458 (+),score=72.20 GFUD01015549.1:61-1434(+)
MKINKTVLRTILGTSQLTYLVDHSDLYSAWFETDGPMDYTIYVLASCQVVLNMFVIVVLLLYPKINESQFNSFYFIINLAATDLIGFVMTITSVFIQQNVWNHQKDYNFFNPEIFVKKMRTGCRWQMGLLTFSYLNTVLATTFLTLDRNIFISKPLRYSLFVTKKKIIAMICISWIFPILSGCVTFFTTNLDEVKMCIVTHTSSKWPNFVTAVLVFLTIITIYILYAKILLRYWGLKRKISLMRKNRYDDQEEADKKGSLLIAQKAQKILEFLNNSRYVIFVMFTFTICWIPWILNVFYDIFVHQVLSNQSYEDTNCPYSVYAEENIHPSNNSWEEFQGQACVHAIMRGRLTECEVPGKKQSACEAVHEHMHDYLIICISRLCICFSMLSSLINPCIHGFWYPGFRQALEHLKTRMTQISAVNEPNISSPQQILELTSKETPGCPIQDFSTEQIAYI